MAPGVRAEEQFYQFVKTRRTFSWALAAAMLVAYFAFILLIAFAPDVLGTPIVAGHSITWGIPVGLGMLAFTFGLVALYVHRANSTYDSMLDGIRLERQS
ncbi:DUF485 domain-containing protein [Trinickia symbiotica]|uniref:DUF485 domain-containing protein n=2 Tax=Trinickia symbiotica TaxID=863227 RepID=A0A2T3XTX9_9BURK|nr:DUF485 domain-containing protein [Trinickia symbiotica]